jgi:hypothetical protein
MDAPIPNPIEATEQPENGEPASSSAPASLTTPAGEEPLGSGRRHGRQMRVYPWLGGAILILLGVVFLLQNLGIPFLENWWALFILIPAFWFFSGTWSSYQHNGRLTRGAGFSLAWGVLLTILSLVFLFNLDLGLYWPLLLIAAGVILLGMSLLPAGSKPPQ